jgi:predicted nucleotide-binding protein
MARSAKEPSPALPEKVRPRLFIGSSTEGLHLATALQESLSRIAEVTVWHQGVFDISATVIETLVAALDKHQFSVFVFRPTTFSNFGRRGSMPSATMCSLSSEICMGNSGKQLNHADYC